METQNTKIELKMTPFAKVVYKAAVVTGYFFAIVSVLLLLESLAAGKIDEIVISLGGIVLFGWGSLFVDNLIKKNAGYLEINQNGITIDSYLGIGIIEWENFAKGGVVSLLGAKMVGICIKDPQKYIESREKMTFATELDEMHSAQSIMKSLMKVYSILPVQKIINILLAIVGWAELPKTAEEIDVLDWNYKSFGYHLFIHSFWFKDDKKIVNTMNEYKQKYSVEVQEEKQVESIKCPMCAELIKAEAKVCRFCHYSFEEKKFVG